MKPLVVILGPTAVGKTSVGIQLCQKIHGEIVSGDSMLIYKDMNIGTAKPSLAERQHIPHHMIDLLNPSEAYNVAEFQAKATCCIEDIQQRGNIPILLGGTGLYVRAIVEGYQFCPASSNDTLRKQLQAEVDKYGNQYLWDKLNAIDPVTAKRLHFNDQRRIIRAIEVYQNTGAPLSSQYQADHNIPYDLALIGLTMPRELLYERINHRVDTMIESGLESEVRQLLDKGYHAEMVAMKGLGYRQMIGYIAGEYDLEYAVYLIKRDTRHFAKRQMTLFKKISGIAWFDVSKYLSVPALVEDIYMDIAGKICI